MTKLEKVIYYTIITVSVLFLSTSLFGGECQSRARPFNWNNHRSYNDKYYGFPNGGYNPVPPNFRIHKGFRDGHYWRFGGRYSSPDRSFGEPDGAQIWFGYEIEF